MIIIKDSIYRFVQVPELCRQFIDTPQFQRLRGIKQLGLCYFVFPSATHTRFEHSIGVMHLCGELIDHLRDNCGIAISPRNKLLVQLAGLLHDQGHLCFSHLIDKLPDYEAHEERSVDIFRQQNQDLGRPLSEEEEKMVLDMILGNVNERKNDPQPFLYEIVSNKSNGVECDRLDYLQRDAYYCGMSGFQGDYLMLASYVDKDGRLALRPKADTELKLMLATRQRMFSTVYLHPKVLKVQKMFLNLLQKYHIRPKEDEEDGDVLFRLKAVAKKEYEQFLLRGWKKEFKEENK